MSSRRDLLGAVATTGAFALAGCTGIVETDGDDPVTTPDHEAAVWAYDTGGLVQHAPAVSDGTVYAAGGRGDGSPPEGLRREVHADALFALSAAAGDREWRYDATAAVGESPTPAPGGCYAIVGWPGEFSGTDQRVVAVDGDRRWASDPVDQFRHVLGVGDGAVYAGTSDDALALSGQRVDAFDHDGATRWTVDGGDAGDGQVHDGLLLAGYGGRALAALDTDSGEQRWLVESEPLGPEFGETLAFDGHALVGSEMVRAVSLDDGSESWSVRPTDVGNVVMVGAVRAGETLVVTEYGGHVFGLDPATGEQRWRHELGGDASHDPGSDGERAYVGTSDGAVVALTPAGDEAWTATVPGAVMGFTTVETGVVVRTKSKAGSALVALAEGEERWRYERSTTPPATDGKRVYVGAGSEVVALE